MKILVASTLILSSLFAVAHAQGLPRETAIHFGSAFIIEDLGWSKRLSVKYKPSDTDMQSWTLLTGRSLTIKQTGVVEGTPVLIIEYQPDVHKPEHATVLVWSNGKQWSVEDPYYKYPRKPECLGLKWEIAPDGVQMKSQSPATHEVRCTWDPAKRFRTVAEASEQRPGQEQRSSQQKLSDDPQVRAFQSLPLYRLVRDGCSVAATNDAMTEVTFGRLANWLEAKGEKEKARRIRLIQAEQKSKFAPTEEAIATYVAKHVSTTGKGTEWDPQKLLPIAVKILGGEEKATKFLAASHQVLLKEFMAPSDYFYRSQNIDPDGWLPKPSSPLADASVEDATEISGMTQLYPKRASFELPLATYRFLIEGRSYGKNPISTTATDSLRVKATARQYVDDVRRDSARKIAGDGEIPNADLLAKYLAAGPDVGVEINSDADRALAFATWIPNLCLTYQISLVSPTMFSQEVIEKAYIGALKTRKEW